MSKIGKKPIIIPENVKVQLEGQILKFEGPRGCLRVAVPKNLQVKLDDKTLTFLNTVSSKQSLALWGTTRALAKNAIEGVTGGFEKTLEVEGIGFRVQKEGKDLVLNLGFSHPLKFSPPEGIEIILEKNKIIVRGIDKDLVGRTSAQIRALKKPEPYKGKGIRYEGEIIRKKTGKKVGGAVAGASKE